MYGLSPQFNGIGLKDSTFSREKSIPMLYSEHVRMSMNDIIWNICFKKKIVGLFVNRVY